MNVDQIYRIENLADGLIFKFLSKTSQNQYFGSGIIDLWEFVRKVANDKA